MEGRPVASRLTLREREIANLIGLGFTNRQIGAKLSISERTVGAHVQNILNKLGANNRAQIATWSAEASRGTQPSGAGGRTARAPDPVPRTEITQPIERSMHRPGWVAGVIAAVAITVAATDDGVRPSSPANLPRSQAPAADNVVVPPGGRVQIAVVVPITGESAAVGAGAWNAVLLAVEKQSRIKGFAVQLNKFNGPCGSDDGLNVLAANQVVANPQNVAVIGHFCSNHFIEALPIYEAAGVVTVSGSATNPTLASFGRGVFNAVAISDSCCPYQDNFDPWYAEVSQLPADLLWRQQDYAPAFGAPPPPYADFYFDAASLLLQKIASSASLDAKGNLVVGRPALALAVRTTTAFQGVTCDVTLASSGFRVDDPVSLNKCASTQSVMS